jgi:hypothetical protein
MPSGQLLLLHTCTKVLVAPYIAGQKAASVSQVGCVALLAVVVLVRVGDAKQAVVVADAHARPRSVDLVEVQLLENQAGRLLPLEENRSNKQHLPALLGIP